MNARFSVVEDVVRRSTGKILYLLGIIVLSLVSGSRALAVPAIPDGTVQPASVRVGNPVPEALGQHALPLQPYLEWLPDTAGMSLEDVVKADTSAQFQPLPKKLPITTAGACWLRFTLSPWNGHSSHAPAWLDLGPGIPGSAQLYVVRPAPQGQPEGEGRQRILPVQTAFFPLPEVPDVPLTLYLRLENLPGLWFTPVLRSDQNAATDPGRLEYPALLIVLGVVLLLCLLRGLTEQGAWRLWTVAYVAVALFQAFWGIPVCPDGHLSMNMLPGILAPGIALMLLPHVGRHLMGTPRRSPVLDIQYIFLTLAGAVLALLPLFSPLNWLCRYLNVWPLGSLLLVPTTVGAWLMGLPGAVRFLLACLAPGITTLISVLASLGVNIPLPLDLTGTAPLWGVALGAMFIAGTAPAREEEMPAKAAQPLSLDGEGTLELAEKGLLSVPEIPGAEVPEVHREMPQSETILSVRGLEAAHDAGEAPVLDTGAPLPAAELSQIPTVLVPDAGLLPELGKDTASDLEISPGAEGGLSLARGKKAELRAAAGSTEEKLEWGEMPAAGQQGQEASAAAELSLEVPARDMPSSLPHVVSLLPILDQYMQEARAAFQKQEVAQVETVAAHLAAHADACGLRVLARIARCVEGAARAQDGDALNHLLPELESAVERNRMALVSGR